MLDKTRSQMVADARRAARQAQRAVRWRAFLWFLASAILLIVGLLVGDCILQREEAGLRWLWLGVAIAAIAGFARSLLLPALRFECSTNDVARWLEKRSPQSRCHLSVALELSEIPSDDPRFGSSAFRDAAMSDWLATSAPPEWKNVVRWDEVRRAMIGLCAVVAIGVLFFSFWPKYGLQASRRLLMPWSTEHWPRKNQLAFVDLPATVGQGTSLQVEVIDTRVPISRQEPQSPWQESRYPVPDDIVIEVREAENASSVRTILPQIVSNAAVTSLPPLQQDLELRATGGDDRSMAWHKIRVMPIPQWKSSRFDVTLPEYVRSSERARRLLASDESVRTGRYSLTGNRIDVPTGSRVQFYGELERAVEAVQVTDSTMPASADSDKRHSVDGSWSSKLDSSGKRVQMFGNDDEGLLVNESIQWTLAIRTIDGCFLESPVLWKIEAIADRPPEVVLEPAQVSSIAAGVPVPIAALVRDDWGLRDVTIKLSVESKPDLILEMRIPIDGKEYEYPIQTQWDFASDWRRSGGWFGPQEFFLLWVEAHDHLGQLGRSQSERWSIESPDRQLELLAKRQTATAKHLQELLDMQATSHQLARKIRDQLSEESIRDSHLDAISSVEQMQQAISRQLSESSDGVSKQIQQTVQLLEHNRLSGSDLHSQLTELLEELESESRPRAVAAWEDSAEFRSALQSMLDGTASSSAWQTVSTDLERTQTASMQSLQSLVEKLDKNQALNRLRQDLQNMASQQKTLSEATRQAQLNSLRDGSDIDQSELSALTNRQLELARQLEQWAQQTNQVDTIESASGSPLRDQLDSASRVLTQSQAAASMREASQRIQSRQIGSAVDSQQIVDNAFREAIGQIAQSDVTTPQNQTQTAMELQKQQLSFLRESLTSLIETQRAITAEYQELAVRLRQAGESNELLASSRTVIERQESLRSSLQTVREQSDQLMVFQWALDQASSDMARASATARRRRFDPDAVSSSQDAHNKLSAIQESLAQVIPDEDKRQKTEPGTDEVGNSTVDDTSPATFPLASLKLIRALQLELSRQTEALDQTSDPVRQGVRRSELAGQQLELAEKLKMLLEVLQSSPSVNVPSDPVSGQETQR